MRTIKTKLGSLTKLIEIKTDVQTFGEFHNILSQQAGELFDLEQIDNTKFDFVVMNLNTIYGQRMDAILPATDFYFLVVPRQNKGNAISRELEIFYGDIFMKYSVEIIKELRGSIVRKLLEKYNSLVHVIDKLDFFNSTPNSELRRLFLNVYTEASDYCKGKKIDKEEEILVREEKEEFEEESKVTILKDPKLKPVMVADCNTCSYKEHYEKEVVEAEYQRVNHEKVRI